MTVQEWLGKNNKLGVDIYEEKYRFNNETLNETFKRLSGGNETLERLISERKFLFGGRTTANRNTGKKASMMNCYSRGFIKDSLDDIMQANTDIAMTFKAQGGQGLSLSKLRPKGCGINHGQYTSDGIIPFMELFNRTTESISQGGSRKGALLIGLDIWHKEAEDFIKIKSEEGRIQKANLSLEIDDEFMECVKEYYKTGKVITKHIIRNYDGNKVEYDVTPINLYKLMMDKAYDWAEPGCIFTNKFRNYNLMEYCDDYKIEICNPCVTGDTLILTENGHLAIKDVVGKDINIWNGYSFSKVKPEKTGENQELYKITFSNGSELKCTPYHKFILNDDTRVEAKNLKVGSKLKKCNYPIINGTKLLPNAYTQGFYSGDGFECSDRNVKYISFYGEHKKPLSKCCATINLRETSEKRDTYSVDVYYDKKFVPINDYTVESKIRWLEGLCDSDGSNNNDGSITITSVEYDFLKKVLYMLETLGIQSTLSKCKEESEKYFPKGMGNSIYHTKNLYRISIGASDVLKLNCLGFNPHRVSNKCVPNRSAKRDIYIKSIEKLAEKEDVYCFSEPINHSGIFNGVMTAQCGEQPLKKNSACDLGSINLSEFVINPFTPEAYFDFDEFAIAIDEGVRALDCIIDENKDNHALQEQKEASLNYRNIGLGTMGMWDMLCKLNLKYGSEDSKIFIDELYGFMFRRAVIASSNLAKEKGAFPMYNNNVLKSEIIKKHFSEDDIKILEIDKYGLRNCSLLSIAPTGSIGTLFNISTGCEPAFQISYKRKTESLKGKEKEYDVYIGLAKEFMNQFNTDKLPDTFITASEIHWKDRIDIQSIIQKHIDTAISSTVNLPESCTKEEIEQLYLYAWEKGLKGVTIFRAGCKRDAILTSSDDKSDNKKEKNEVKSSDIPRGYVIKVDGNTVGKERHLNTGCGTLHLCNFFDPISGDLLNDYINKGSTGGCFSNLIAISRLISYAARSGCDINGIADQLLSVPPCPAYVSRRVTKHDTSKGSCCPNAIGYAMLEMYNELQNELGNIDEKEEKKFEVDKDDISKKNLQNKSGNILKLNKCPKCGEEAYVPENGCYICHACGYSKCE